MNSGGERLPDKFEVPFSPYVQTAPNPPSRSAYPGLDPQDAQT